MHGSAGFLRAAAPIAGTPAGTTVTKGRGVSESVGVQSPRPALYLPPGA